MKRLKEGSALSTVILMIFVMTVIGSSVMNLVVYNYRLRQLDIKIRRAEYKNEIIMDKVYEIAQNSILTSIGMAKKYSIDVVDKAVEEEEELYKRYTAEKDRLSIEWANENAEVEFANENDYVQSLNAYIENNLDQEYQNISFSYLNSGVPNQYVINNEYDNVFRVLYKYTLDRNQTINLSEALTKHLDSAKREINNTNPLIENIIEKDKYDDVLSNPNQDLFFDEDSFNERIGQEISGDVVNIESELDFNVLSKKFVLTNNIKYKVKGVPATELSADFVISIPNFDDISAFEQKTVEFSNPLIGQKALIAGGILTINNGSQVTINGDALARSGIVGNTMNLSSNGKLITGGDIVLNNSQLDTNIVYYQNLFLRGENESIVTFRGNVYAKDDLEIETNNFKVNQILGNYYGFNDCNEEKGEDTSSSIIINSQSINSESYITLNNLYLAGRAFIDKVVDLDGNEYKTGESISVIGNYIAYQSPITDTTSDYSSDKVNFGSYIFNSSRYLNLINSFVGKDSKLQLADFDVNHKWRYFVEFANSSLSSLTVPNITINDIKYMQGAGVGKVTSAGSLGAIEAKLTSVSEPAFRTNCANEYDLQTKYLGYYSANTEIFGENGWLNDITVDIESQPQNILVKDTGVLELNEQDLNMYRIIICSGDIDINVSSETNFYGVMIAGGDININGNVNFVSRRTDIINLILEGADEEASANSRNLFQLFKYDYSGNKYIITIAGDSYINMNNLLGIINWNKKNWGYL